MASNILSRLLPSASDDGLSRRHSIASDDIENNAAMAIDEENLNEPFHEHDLEQLLAEAQDEVSEAGTEGPPFIPVEKKSRRSSGSKKKPKWMKGTAMDDDDDVPQSLMLQGGQVPKPKRERKERRASGNARETPPPPVAGPSTQNTQAQWEATRTQQRLYDNVPGSHGNPLATRIPGGGPLTANPKDRAMWRWTNVQNLDGFLGSVYYYYKGHGIWSICLRRALTLLTLVFVMTFLSFMMFCIDYTKLPASHGLADIRIPKCSRNLPLVWSILLWVIAVGWLYMLFTFITDIPRLYELHDFFHYLLEIDDGEIQTASWQYVVGRLMALRDANPNTASDFHIANRKFIAGQSKQRMDAHDIANRLMRKDNYWIAMINRDILNTTLKVPFFGKRHFFSRTLEWNIGLAVNEFVFDQDGHIRPAFTTSKNRRELIETLRRRFFLLGVMNIFMAPILVSYFVIRHFFAMIMEYQKNPAELGSRGFTPHAEWKMREYNELEHLFHRRKVQAYPYADAYLSTFPKDKTGQVAKFIVFVTGAVGGVLGLISMLDPELFLGFEINGRTIVFWLGTIAFIWNNARGAVPPEHMAEDPEEWLNLVNQYTRYVPPSWHGRLNTYEVQQEFSSLYKLELIMFMEELASVILTPIIFIFNLPQCSEQIIDFFREFTLHVDGLGHVCTFAVFNFKNGGQPRTNVPAGDPRADFYKDRDDKLSQSVMFFQDTYAGVPKRGLGQRKHPFQLPPTFPGLGSIHGPVGLHNSMMAARLATQNAQMAEGPMHSVLLDPHHQPRSSPRVLPQTRHRGGASRHDGSPKPTTYRTSSKIIEEDSELGDSWAVRADAGVENRDGNGDGGDGMGVVGNFLKAVRHQSTRGGGIKL
ncbi:APG9-domain-containing protein [Tothia fuscella]|uniref:Autophagy-related protein 9 n=1 Tax=Tothia fuscella TaxID=1048955 RepID=A0A9P4TW70_9PEZI|nr:APG9-domain-containing protein [Tothia fuscella]